MILGFDFPYKSKILSIKLGWFVRITQAFFEVAQRNFEIAQRYFEVAQRN